MPSHPVRALTLERHPETPAAAEHAVHARVGRAPGGLLAVSFVIEGDLDRLLVPQGRELSGRAPSGRERSERVPGMADRLWEHTCCEIFIARTGLPAYHEFNFSPSGEWAVYAFAGYRERVPFAGESNAEDLDPQVAVRRAPGRLELDAAIRLGRLSAAHLDAGLLLALSAVVEERDGSLSYWALRHPPGRPDFHHRHGYALELAQADRSPA